MLQKRIRQGVALASIVIVLSFVQSPHVIADDHHVRGTITKRSADGTIVVRTDTSSNLEVVLSDSAKVRRTDGLRQESVSSASLIPGLRIRLSGWYEEPARFVAERVTFSRADLKIALAIKGGVDPTDQRSLENQRRIAENTRIIEHQQQTLSEQAQQITANQEQTAANQEKIVATAGALEVATARIGKLDDYNSISTVTVYFANGKASIASKYQKQLQGLAEQAKKLNGYLIQVEGFASAVGPASLNQRLSMQRADAVTAVLSQSGIPPTRLAVPAAMGVTGQVAPNKTAQGQAQNRRTVVTLLQNKGLSGQ
jgi:outer membrane protein OmpA-like peptidoglycan-associated protein